jgi:hypothetical protein
LLVAGKGKKEKEKIIMEKERQPYKPPTHNNL